MRRAFSMMRSAAVASAPPPVIMLRLPKVPVPCWTAMVSPCWTATWSIATLEQVGRDLRERRLVALAVRAGAGEHGDLARALDADGAALEARAAARLDERGDAHADQLALRRAARPAARISSS